MVDRVDTVFKALADPHRRQLLDRLNARNGQTLRSSAPSSTWPASRSASTWRCWRRASLVTTVRRGREKLHYLNAAPINEIADRWITRYDRARVARPGRPQDEHWRSPAMDKPEFVYTTYIRTTPERLWPALTEPAFTEPLLGHRVRDRLEDRLADDVGQHGVVDRATPSRSCSSPTRPAGCRTPGTRSRRSGRRAIGIDEELRGRIAAEPRSKVTFELEPDGPLVKLTVVHDGFEPGSTVAEMVSGGWPRVLGDAEDPARRGRRATGSRRPRSPTRPADAVFAALTTLDGLAGWWMPDVVGDPEPGGEITFPFDGEHVTMQVVYAERPSLVVWRCTESTRFPEWVGHSLWFDLQPRDASSTSIAFSQVGLVPSCDCYDICSRGWDHYVRSLADVAAGERGRPYGAVR